MRLAWVTVGSALAGTAVALLSIARPGAPPPPSPPPPAPAPELARAEAEPPEAGTCPPCQGTPLDAEGWQVQLTTLDGAVALERAAALSMTLPDAGSISAALAGDDPALRSLAALLLNVGSRRVSSCQTVGEVSVLQLLDRLDRITRAARDGAGPPASALAATAAQADAVSKGLVPGCGP